MIHHKDDEGITELEIKGIEQKYNYHLKITLETRSPNPLHLYKPKVKSTWDGTVGRKEGN
jgi:hypothetical protein